jgi:hypothetical protein
MSYYSINTNINSKEQKYGSIDVVVWDNNGIEKVNTTQDVDSFVRNYWYNFYSSVVKNHVNVLNTSSYITLSKENNDLYNLEGNTHPNANPMYTYFASAYSNSNQYGGILIGTSNTPVAYSDYDLGSRIEFGDGINQIEASRCNVSYSPNTGEAFIVRDFFLKNTQTSSFSINEVGLSVSPADVTGNGANSLRSIFLYVRDTLNSPIVIEQGDRARFSYRFVISNKSETFNNIFLYSRMCLNTVYLFNDRARVKNTQGSTTFFRFFVSSFLGVESPYSQSNYGIIVGSNSVAANISDYRLLDSINHGFNNGNLVYYAMKSSPLYEDNTNGTGSFYVSRDFANRGSVNVIINEVATYIPADAQSHSPPVMMERYVFSNQVNVIPNENVEIRWYYNYSLGDSNITPTPPPVSNVNSYNINLVDNGTYMASLYATNADYSAELSENGNYMASLLALDDSYSVNVVENGTYMLSNVYSSNTEYSAELSANGTYMISNLTANVV